MSILEKINDKEEYTILQIFKNRFFFWYKDYGGVYRTVMKDLKGPNILKTKQVDYAPTRKAYKIKGKNIKKYLQMMMDGKI